MGLFDNKQKETPIPEPLEEDGVYVEKCTKEDCVNYDIRGFCRYEYCVIHPFDNSGCHDRFMRTCKICKEVKDFAHLRGDICEDCLNKLGDLI